jgi:hypothetical protein
MLPVALCCGYQGWPLKTAFRVGYSSVGRKSVAYEMNWLSLAWLVGQVEGMSETILPFVVNRQSDACGRRGRLLRRETTWAALMEQAGAGVALAVRQHVALPADRHVLVLCRSWQ